MQKITPHLWYDKEAREAAELYVSLFPDSKIIHSSELEGTPSGTVDMLSVQLMGQQFSMISAGPYFKFTPAISLLVLVPNKAEVDRLYNQLIVGGSALMELGSYPFSEQYGWLADRYGLNWQIMHAGDAPIEQHITPTLMFTGEVCGKAEEAIKLYMSLFDDAKLEHVMRYEAGEEPNKVDTIKHASFRLGDDWLAAMDSALDHNFTFNEAVSLMVSCKDQAEIDHFWEKLSAVPEAEQCGWLKDKYGVSWQIVPQEMDTMMAQGSKEQIARLTQAFLKMKKFDLAELKKAYEGV